MTTTVKAQDVKPGMVISIYAGTERIAVEYVNVDAYSVGVADYSRAWRGLSHNESVTVLGYFNV